MSYKKKYLNYMKIKEKMFPSGDFYLQFSVCLSDMDKEDVNLYEENGKKYLHFNVAARQEKGRYGSTHYAYRLLKENDNLEENEEDTKVNPDDLPF